MTVYVLELLMWLTLAVVLGLSLRPYLYGKGSSREHGHKADPR